MSGSLVTDTELAASPSPSFSSCTSWELLAPASQERSLPGPLQKRPQQGRVLQNGEADHCVDGGGCQRPRAFQMDDF